MNCPDVVSIGIVWDSEESQVQHIVDLLHALGTTLRLSDVSFLNVCFVYIKVKTKIFYFQRRR